MDEYIDQGVDAFGELGVGERLSPYIEKQGRGPKESMLCRYNSRRVSNLIANGKLGMSGHLPIERKDKFYYYKIITFEDV